MGYDETDRPRRRQGRGRQPVKRMGDREIPYRRNGEPGRSEPGLDLITDSFRDRGRRSRRTASSGGHSSGNPQMPGRAGGPGNSPAYGGNRAPGDISVSGGYRASAGPSVSFVGHVSEGPVIMSGRRTLSGPEQQAGDRVSGAHHGNSSSSALHQTAAARSASSGRRPAEAGKKKSREPGRPSIYEDSARRRAKRRRQKIRILLLEALVFLGVLAFAGYSYLNSRLGLMQRLPWNPEEIRNVEISEEKQEQMKGYWTIAIFGVDSRNESVGKGNNSDVNIICNINQDTGEIRLVSVFRDSYLNINDKNSYNKINTAYLNGGPEQAVKALNKNLDLDIDDYATFNWKAVADAINILGGIDVEISKKEFYYINAFISETVSATGVGSHQLKQAGMNHLDGVQAVAYGRLRLMDTDYARTERQRKVIALAFEKAKNADWATINNIIQTVFPQVATSVDMGSLLAMGRGITKYHLTETMGFPSARGEAKIKSKGACVVPQTLESNVVELHRFLFGDEDYTPTEAVKSISRRITSDTGLSKAAAPAGEAGTGGGLSPGSSATAGDSPEKGVSERMREKAESKAEEESRAQEKNQVSPYGYLETTGESETDSRGNLILPFGGYKTEEESSRSREKPWGSEGETEGGSDYPSGTAACPSEASPELPGASGNPGTQPGTRTNTGVIIAPGTMTPGGPSGTGTKGNSGTGTPGTGRPEETSGGRVEFYGPPGT